MSFVDVIRLNEVYAASYPPGILNGGGANDPHIASLAPNTAVVSVATTVTVNGSNFAPDAQVEVNQVALTTTFVSATQLTASYTAATVGAKTFTVRNVGAAEESNAVTFTVTATQEEPRGQSDKDREEPAP